MHASQGGSPELQCVKPQMSHEWKNSFCFLKRCHTALAWCQWHSHSWSILHMTYSNELLELERWRLFWGPPFAFLKAFCHSCVWVKSTRGSWGVREEEIERRLGDRLCLLGVVCSFSGLPHSGRTGGTRSPIIGHTKRGLANSLNSHPWESQDFLFSLCPTMLSLKNKVIPTIRRRLSGISPAKNPTSPWNFSASRLLDISLSALY